MAVPFRRTSKSKKRMRRSHQALKTPGMIACSSCGELILTHKVCPHCGSYKGKVVKVINTEEEQA